MLGRVEPAEAGVCPVTLAVAAIAAAVCNTAGRGVLPMSRRFPLCVFFFFSFSSQRTCLVGNLAVAEDHEGGDQWGQKDKGKKKKKKLSLKKKKRKRYVSSFFFFLSLPLSLFLPSSLRTTKHPQHTACTRRHCRQAALDKCQPLCCRFSTSCSP